MKKIYVVRHAKSSWSNLALSDKERPLNNRGKRDAPIMAAWCKSEGYIPDQIISSTANRASTTAKVFEKVFDAKELIFEHEDNLYHAPAQTYIETCYQLEEDVRSVMLFGHNPGITYLAMHIGPLDIPNVATSGVLIIESTAKNWQEVDFDNCTVKRYMAPKLLPS